MRVLCVSKALSAIATPARDRDTTHLPNCADLPVGSQELARFPRSILSGHSFMSGELLLLPYV